MVFVVVVVVVVIVVVVTVDMTNSRKTKVLPSRATPKPCGKICVTVWAHAQFGDSNIMGSVMLRLAFDRSYIS